MLNDSIRILNFDDSVIKQQRLISQFRTEIVDLKDIGPQARIWLDKKTKYLIEERIRDSAKDSITFLGSSDFHHISHLLISQFDEPISVIDFDFHPDWDTLPPHLGCGSWVSETLKNKNILKFILIGVSSCDISSFWIQTGNLNSLQNDRVEIYPYSHRPSWAFFKKVLQNASVRKTQEYLFSSRIYWTELKTGNLREFFLDILKHLPSKKVYVSLDKDCLRADYALTNWEGGHFTLEEILMFLRLIKERLDIIGVDITGDYSPPLVTGKIKAFFSHLDHPRDYTAKDKSEGLITSINEKTNISILELLEG